MEICYVYRKEVEQNNLIEIYKKEIIENPRFLSEIEEEKIAITSGFLIYPFLDGQIKNLEYLVLRHGKQQSGVIDASYHLISKDFLLRELKTKDFSIEEHSVDDYVLFNKGDIEEYEKVFIQRLLDKTSLHICKRHNLILTERTNDIDISPIQKFENYNKTYYLEEVYMIDYFSKKRRKPFQSLYSPLSNTFYELDFEKSVQFCEFLKTYKRPIVYIPKDYMDLYYDISFEVYVSTQEELKYISSSTLFHKIRKNIKYKEYSKYEDYLKQLIFYFRKKEYLREYENHFSGLKQKIFYSFLTLNYNPQSGYDLADLVHSHIIEGNYVKFLEISAKQGNTLAKKTLFEYYSEPKNYNAYYLKRYS